MRKISEFIPLVFILTVFVSGISANSILPKHLKLDEMLVVNAIGVDIENRGNDQKFKITLAYTDPDANGGISMLTAEGSSFFEAVSNATAYAGKSIYLGHSQMLAIGKNAAESGIEQIFDYVTRSNETRLNAFVITSADTAKKLLSVKSAGGSDVLSDIKSLIRNTSQNSVSFPMTLGEFTADHTDSLRYPVTPLIYTVCDENGTPTGNVMTGCAVYKQDKLLTFITSEDAYTFTLLKNKSGSHVCVSDVSGTGCVSSQVNSAKTSYSFNADETGGLRLDLIVDLRVTVVESSSGKFSVDAINKLSDQLKNEYTDRVNSFFEKCKYYNEDVCNIEDVLRRHGGKLYDLFSGVKDIEVYVDTHITIENSTIYGEG